MCLQLVPIPNWSLRSPWPTVLNTAAQVLIYAYLAFQRRMALRPDLLLATGSPMRM